jgi:hypothetical protein
MLWGWNTIYHMAHCHTLNVHNDSFVGHLSTNMSRMERRYPGTKLTSALNTGLSKWLSDKIFWVTSCFSIKAVWDFRHLLCLYQSGMMLPWQRRLMSPKWISASNWHELSPRFFHYYLTLFFPLLEDFRHHTFPIQVQEWILIDMCQRTS